MTVTDFDDARLAGLLADCVAGDPSAFEVLYRMTWHRVNANAYRVLRDAAQAEEVAQEVYLDLWAHADRYDPSQAPVMPYLLMLTHRRAISRVRSSQAALERDTTYTRKHIDRERDEASELALERLAAAQLRSRINRLANAQREAITLAFLHGLSHSEVSKRLDVPLGTAKSRIRDALIALREPAPRT